MQSVDFIFTLLFPALAGNWIVQAGCQLELKTDRNLLKCDWWAVAETPDRMPAMPEYSSTLAPHVP